MDSGNNLALNANENNEEVICEINTKEVLNELYNIACDCWCVVYGSIDQEKFKRYVADVFDVKFKDDNSGTNLAN